MSLENGEIKSTLEEELLNDDGIYSPHGKEVKLKDGTVVSVKAVQRYKTNWKLVGIAFIVGLLMGTICGFRWGLY